MFLETIKKTEDKPLTDIESVTGDETSGNAGNPSACEAPEAGNLATDGENLLKLILTQQIQYFIDRTGEPCLILPGDDLGRAYPIQSRRVRAYIANLAWKSGRMLPKTAELDRVLRVLEGLAWEHSPRDASREQIWNRLQDTPVLQVVIEFMREREKHETRMQILHKELGELAFQLKFDMYSKRWPKTAAHLSAQLRQGHHRGILEQCGISVEIDRDRNGAKVVLKRVTPRIPDDDDEPSASPPASQSNSRPGSNLPASDAGDGKCQIDDLEAQIRSRMDKLRNTEPQQRRTEHE